MLADRWDEPDDDDVWVDDQDDLGDDCDDEFVRCPECGGDVPEIIDRCPACGYWLTDADRDAADRSMQPRWLRVTAIIVLLVFLASLLAVGSVLF